MNIRQKICFTAMGMALVGFLVSAAASPTTSVPVRFCGEFHDRFSVMSLVGLPNPLTLTSESKGNVHEHRALPSC